MSSGTQPASESPQGGCPPYGMMEDLYINPGEEPPSETGRELSQCRPSFRHLQEPRGQRPARRPHGRRIRLLLVDAPEMDQGPFGEVVRTFLAGLTPPGATL